MKAMFILGMMLAPYSSLALGHEDIALERFSYEIRSTSDKKAKIESAILYFETLDRLGSAPFSTGKCFDSILSDRVSSACKPTSIVLARAGSGTGGVD